MQPEAHFNTSIIGNSFLETFVLFVFLERVSLGDISDHFHKSKNRQVSLLTYFRCLQQLNTGLFSSFSDLAVALSKFPHQQKSISNIFIRTS